MRDPIIGTCRLCKYKAVLQESHVWPKFGYRDFVAEQSTGGSFVDVAKRKTTNRQLAFHWYCKQCEGKMSVAEKAAKELIAKLLHSSSAQQYDKRLHRFLVSISLRTVEYFYSNGQRKQRRLEKAFTAWRKYIIEQTEHCNPYSQHVFAVVDQKAGLHKAMGGRIFQESGAVFSQVGPLIIVGFFDKSKLSFADLKIWESTEVRCTGGQIERLTEWRVGKNITMDFIQKFSEHEQEICDMARESTRKSRTAIQD